MAALTIVLSGAGARGAEPPAHCESAPACRKLLQEGRELLAGGKPEQARAALQSAFDQSQDPSILVSLGRSLQLLEKRAAAREVYRSYLTAAAYDAPERAQVVAWFRETLADGEEAQPPAQPTQAAEPAGEAVGAGVASPAAPSPAPERKRAPLSKGQIALRVVGGMLIPLGAAGLIVGAVYTSMNPRPAAGGAMDPGGLSGDSGSWLAMGLSAAAVVEGGLLIGVSFNAPSN